MILNCSRCEKEIFVPDSWTLSERDYKEILCQECKESDEK